MVLVDNPGNDVSETYGIWLAKDELIALFRVEAGELEVSTRFRGAPWEPWAKKNTTWQPASNSYNPDALQQHNVRVVGGIVNLYKESIQTIE